MEDKVFVADGAAMVPDACSSEDNESYYEVSLDRANEKFSDTNYSDWIIHLAGKTWMTMPKLEQLADILKEKAPDNDWAGSLQYAKRILEK